VFFLFVCKNAQTKDNKNEKKEKVEKKVIHTIMAFPLTLKTSYHLLYALIV